MVYFADMTDEERIARLERNADEARKMLFGALSLARELWKKELSQREEGIEIMKTMEKAEEAFDGRSHPDRFIRFEQALDVINQRAKSIFDLMSYISKHGWPDHSRASGDKRHG